ncbi:MAG: multiple sugar transport system permease protein [Frankiaceae bacterium]|jgi:multiple sugar transport system permease protein|nr:multiple sugar transport system permease protein [Frankiaceae bacterium]
MRSRYAAGLGLLAAPFVAGVVLLVLVPAVVTAAYAFTDYDGFSPARWAGLATIRTVLADPEVRSSLRATGAFLLLALPLRLAGSLGLALLANARGSLAGATRLAVYTPAVVPEPATALVWLWIVNPYYGPLGAVIRLFGGTPGPLLLDPWGARLTIVAVSAFALGEGFLVALAARREVPATLYDAARIEGAGPWAQFRRVTLPLLAPTLALLLARDLLTSMQSALVPTLLLTRGGPLGATKTLPALVYERGFREGELSQGAALALLLLVAGVLLLLLALVLRAVWRRPAGR